MFTKTEIFKDIQKNLREDYSGCVEKASVNRPENYYVTDDMPDNDFESLIQSYLLDFKDGHLWFTHKNSVSSNIGFRVRRFEDELYVIKADEEKRIEVKDKILLVDGHSIPQMEERYFKELEESDYERQQWQYVLKNADKIIVERNDVQFEINLANYEPSPYTAEYIFKEVDKNTGYLKVTDFAEEKPILDIIKNNEEALHNVKNLIIDVRTNYGGNDEFYFPLLDYIFDYSVKFKDLFAVEEKMYTNYTTRNCDLWIDELQDYLKQDLDEETREILYEEIESFQANYGKGFQEVPEDSEHMIKGTSSPEHVYVLTDYYCGSSGDTFVANVKKSNKVTVVGRPTMGIMNYFNVVTVDYGDYEFVYSISKMTGENTFGGEGGIEPDIYLQWTPEHLERDVDLEYVYSLIDSRDEMRKV